jgi:hypothetical protein
MARAGARLGPLASIVAMLLLARDGRAEPFDPNGRDWEGYAEFVEIARAKMDDRFVVASRIDFDDLRADDALLLVHPEGSLDVDSLSMFMASGGRVVLLDDFGTGDRLLRRLGIRRVAIPLRPAESLRHNPDLAIAEPIGDGVLTHGLSRVVTNHPTALLEPRLTPFLEIRGETGDVAVVAMLGIVSRGALVAVGDPSALMNSMLRYPGNKNLVENLLAWSFESRSGRVYFVSGAFEERGTFRGSDTEPTGAPHAPESLFGMSLGPWFAHLLAALLGLGVVLWVGSRAGRPYKIAEPRLSRAVPLLAQGGSAGRAAALGARGATRDRAMLEIGKALEENLTLVLGLDRVPVHDVLFQKLEDAGLLQAESLKAVRDVFARVAHIDALTRAGKTHVLRRVRDAEVVFTAKVAFRILDSLHSNARRKGVA